MSPSLTVTRMPPTEDGMRSSRWPMKLVHVADSEVPCSNCVRRQCGHICPENVQGHEGLRLWVGSRPPVTTNGRLSDASDRLENYDHDAEAGHDHGSDQPPDPMSTESLPPHLPSVPIAALPTTALESSGPSSTNAGQGRPEQIPSGPTESLSIYEAGSWASYSPAQCEQHRPQDEGISSGTLLLANGGRSKYLGPNASSEWIRDVSPQQC